MGGQETQSALLDDFVGNRYAFVVNVPVVLARDLHLRGAAAVSQKNEDVFWRRRCLAGGRFYERCRYKTTRARCQIRGQEPAKPLFHVSPLNKLVGTGV